MSFFQRSPTDGPQHMEICSSSLIIREVQIKTTVKYPITPIRMAVIKKTMTAIREDVEEGEPSCSVDENANCTATVENSMQVPQKSKNGATIWE